MNQSPLEKFAINTERLRLLPLTLEELYHYFRQPGEPEKSGPITISQSIRSKNLDRAISMKVEKMRGADKEDHLWYTYWLIQIKEDGFGAGMVGFKGVPNMRGEVEIGYGLDPMYQSRGFMTEAVNALIVWAFGHAECRSVIADNVERSNLASNRVLEKVGMKVYCRTETSLCWRIDKPQA
jgi:ribosomal-protein-alanine N-acetyltransferase